MVVKKEPGPAEIEYTIYTFDIPKGDQKGENKWERQDVMKDMNKAIKKAESLLGTGKYQKVEVKKKFHDQKTNRTVDMTLKVLEGTVKKDLTVLYLVGGSVAAGIAAFCLSFFLGQGG